MDTLVLAFYLPLNLKKYITWSFLRNYILEVYNGQAFNPLKKFTPRNSSFLMFNCSFFLEKKKAMFLSFLS